jgi:hypothetical protein
VSAREGVEPSIAWRPPERPPWLARLLALGASAGDARLLVSLDPAGLLAAARTSTGLEDFGEGDWREHFAVLVDALERESELHLAGRLLVRAELLRSLRNRLRLHDLWRRRPEILAAPLAAPVFVLGAPRTGTSILHELLALDPASRAPSMWEMLHPVEALAGESLREVGDATVRLWHDLQPEYEAMHENSGDGPNECIFIAMNEFLSDQWSGCHVVPTYEAHLRNSDHRGAYRFHRRFLQTLQLRRPSERWVLKAPSHLARLREIFEIYPDARVVHIHRDPLRTLPSTLSLMGTLKWMRCTRVDMSGAARQLPAGYAAMFRAEIELRARGVVPDERFVDLRYHDLMADPTGAIANLYERLGWTLSAELRSRMADYVSRKPRHARGAHRYSLAAFGLDRDTERERFAFYQRRFAVPDEEEAC